MSTPSNAPTSPHDPAARAAAAKRWRHERTPFFALDEDASKEAAREVWRPIERIECADGPRVWIFTGLNADRQCLKTCVSTREWGRGMAEGLILSAEEYRRRRCAATPLEAAHA